MGKFLLGVATGLVLVFLTVVLLIFAALRFREKPPSIASNSVLVLRLQGEIPEKPPVELPALFGGDGPRLTISGCGPLSRKPRPIATSKLSCSSRRASPGAG